MNTKQDFLQYCPDLFHYSRRESREIRVGTVLLGGENPVRIQSMITSDTRETQDCLKEILDLAEAGCEIVRLTAQTKKYAQNLEHISKAVRQAGCRTPLVADIHFKPDAALEAAKWVEKVRVNPGNYADKKKFEIREYTEEQYTEELARIESQFAPLVTLCSEKERAIRIGTNHGSLSDRIMNRFGDTPQGMVESALEFARIARKMEFHNFIFSMKASNPKVMIEAYRLLVATLNSLGGDWNYPIHLGVTEAGDGEDGRIKSAVGIGSLLNDGIGDTIRVSLTEDAIQEIPVAKKILSLYSQKATISAPYSNLTCPPPTYDPYSYERRTTTPLTLQGIALGGLELVRVFTTQEKWNALSHKLSSLGEFQPEVIYSTTDIMEVDPHDELTIEELNAASESRLITLPNQSTCPHLSDLTIVESYRLLASKLTAPHPILLKDTLVPSQSNTKDYEETMIAAAATIGALLCDGIGDAILIQGESAPGQSLRLSYNVLQAAGARIFKTDYVACPSCGRTLFNLQDTTQKIRQATGHLKGVRIAIMGCIVNGPGEMADADFGYVGGAPNKINLYVGKTPVEFNIPEAEAVERLIDLIKIHKKWREPNA